MRKMFVLMGTAAVLVAGSVSARSFENGSEPTGLDELKKRKGVFSMVLVHPEVDFSRFSRISLQNVALVIRDPASANQFDTGRLLKKREKESVIPEFDEVVEFKRIIGDALVERLSQDLGLEVVDGAGPGTLILQPVVTDVEIDASSKNTSDDGRPLPELKAGTVIFDLLDGETGEIVARFADKRRNRPPKSERVTTGLWPNLPYWAKQAAADLSRELRQIQEAS